MFGNLFKYQYSDGSKCSWNFERNNCVSTTDFDPRNFDNIFRALHTLFVVMTLDGAQHLARTVAHRGVLGWEDVMYTAMSTSGWNKYTAPVFFISFVIITGFLILNLLVAAILDNLQVS